MKRLCVFCGSNPGSRPEYVLAARAMGARLAKENIGLVYGGASVGLMGAIADSVLAAGGEVTGVMPRHLVDREVSHRGLENLRIVGSMHERKALMADLSDGFIALPGGFGTFEEFFEVLTWSQLGLHQKPTGVLNVLDYYQPLLALADQGVREGFIQAAHRGLVLESSDPGDLLQLMRDFKPIALPKWLTPRADP